jgi:hypothetical protein
LKNKIDNLRDRISNSHKDTIRGIQEKLNVPLNKISHTYDDNNNGIETVRIHSRDGSKSIEGSGLELDDYININSWEDRKHHRSNHVEVPQSSKFGSCNTISYHGESIRSTNTLQSKSKDQAIYMKEQDIRNRINVTAEHSYNSTMNEKKNANQYFTIEDVENPKEQINPNFRSERNKYHSNKAQYVENFNETPFNHNKSVKSNKSSSKARGSRDSSWNHSYKRSVNKSKNEKDYSVNSSFNNRNLSRKSRSNHKIKPYSKPWRSGMVKSQKRSQRSDQLNNTNNIKIEEPELMVLRNDSDKSLYSGSDIGEYNEALYSRDNHSARQVNNTAITSLLQNHFNKPNISPKRNKSFYKKKTYTKASKPPLKPYWHRSLDKRNNGAKSSHLHASAKVNTVTNSTEKQRIPSLIRSKTRDIDMTKVNNKIFKSLSECLELINHKEYNKCISKLITVEKLCFTSFPETDVV